MMKPVVSIVIPSYNRAHVLPRAINSILAQTFQDFEIIVVDDCSKDNTDELMKSFLDPRICYVKHSQNKGGNAARNTGIRESRGELVAFLDSDDEWLPTKLEKQLRLFDQPGVGLVYCGFIYTEAGSNEQQLCLTKLSTAYREDLLISNFVGTTSAAVVRKSFLDEIQGFDEELKSCQDWDLYLRLSEVCGFACVEELLVLYYIDRKGKKQISTNPVAVFAGHNCIEKKYAQKIAALPIDKKLKHIDCFIKIYLGISNLRGVKLALEGLKLSGDPKYFVMANKIMIKFFFRKIGWR